MKRFLSAVLAVVATLALTSCDGQEGPVQDPGTMTISVDKTQIESDGIDIATFTIVDASGNVITTEANKGYVYFENVQTGKRLARYSKGFTSIVDGEFEFVGIFNGIKTANSVKITSAHRADYEVFHRNVAIFKLTGTWCQNCPRMTTALHSLDEDAMDHSVVVACHNEDPSHPFYLKYGASDLASAVFRTMGEDSALYPTNCYDMTKLSTSSSTIVIADEIMTRRIESPASVGIAVTAVEIDGTDIKVKAKVKASAAGMYDVACALVSDNLYYPDGYCDNDQNLYHNVAIAVSGDNFLAYKSSSVVEIAKDAEYEKEFSFPFGAVPSKEYTDNMRAVILVHKKTADGGSEINNCAECAFGETLDYRYN